MVFTSTLIICVPFLCAIYSVAGYSIRDGELQIQRLGWMKRFKLSDIKEIEFDPSAMMGAVRIFGIGNCFANVGYFRSGVIGNYRSYCTDEKNAVVICFDDDVKIVVTPEDPEVFVKSVCSLLKD